MRNNRKKTRNKRGIGYGSPPEGRPFKAGNPGGPGRPPGVSLTTIIRRVLAEPDGSYGTKADALIAIAERRARKGDFRFFKELIDRNDGKMPENHTIDSDGKLTVEVVYHQAPMNGHANGNGNGNGHARCLESD